MLNAIYCRNGHFIDGVDASDDSMTMLRIQSAMVQRQKELRGQSAFCPQCGESTINTCQHCNSPIMVDRTEPSFCGVCGKPFPWTESAIAAANEYTDELDELSDEDKVTLKATFSDLTADTPRTDLAVSRFKKFMQKVGPAAGDVLTKIMVNVATEAAKKGMGIR